MDHLNIQLPLKYTHKPIHFPQLSSKPCFNPYEYIPNQDPEIHGSVYLSARKPYAVKYFFYKLYQLEIGDDYLKISRQRSKTAHKIDFFLIIDRYDKNNTLIDHSDTYEEVHLHMEDVEDGFEIITKQLPPAPDYCYARVQIIDLLYELSDMKQQIYECITKNKGFAYIECSNGIVRVNKKILSNASPFFKRLFHRKNVNKYQLDIDCLHLMELIQVLPPYSNDMTCSTTYRALYILSDQLKCLGIADICARFMIKVIQHAALYASWISYEAGIYEEANLYIATKQSVDDYILDLFDEVWRWKEVSRNDFSNLDDYSVEDEVRKR